MAHKLPPNPWYEAVIIRETEGLPLGCRVYVRLSREGGYRVLSVNSQFVVNAAHVGDVVLGVRTAANRRVVASPTMSAALDERLRRIFKSTLPKAMAAAVEPPESAPLIPPSLELPELVGDPTVEALR